MKSVAWALAGALSVVAVARADVVVDYTSDAGGENPHGPSGLAAQARFASSGDQLVIELRNTSTGTPSGADVSDSLLVSLGFDLGDVVILSGDAATIASGSIGLGSWSSLGEHDSVAHQWLWTNQFGGDLLGAYRQVISTSQGFGGGEALTFEGLEPFVGGPFGGIAAQPPLIGVPLSQPAVSGAIEFRLTLSRALGDDELESIARDSIVEFGSDYQYLVVPAPAAFGLLILAGLGGSRRRATAATHRH